MKIYLTRHGETAWNKEGRIQGWHDSNLTEKGIEDAKKLGKSLKNIDFDCIYCSPANRAIQTANFIRGKKDTQIIIKDSLKEMGFGSWEGVEHVKVKELYPVQHYNLWNKPHLYQPIDGECFERLFMRVKEILNEITMNTEYENVLVVSHAIAIKAIYALIKKHPLEELWNSPFIEGTSLSIIEAKKDGLKFVLEADISHLS